MKKIVSVLLIAMLLCGLFALGASAEETKLIDKASEWELLAYEEAENTELTATAPSGWLNKTDSESWTTAQAPFAAPTWAKDISNTLFDWQYYSAFLRKTVTISDVSAINELKMDVIYDENPVLYFNGVEVWSASGYKDADYVTVDLTDKISALKEGENVICVFFSNVFGGGLFDMALTANKGEKPPVEPPKPIDENGRANVASAAVTGFVNFGDINKPENVLDMNQGTVTGSAFNADVEQSVTVTFVEPVSVKSVFVQCKDEGTTTNDDGSRGTYDVYAVGADGSETKLGSLKAVTGTDGGATLKLDKPVTAAGVKIVITSWQGDCWACVADVYALAEAAGDNPPVVDPPHTGENTVWFVLFSAVALFGCAVAVRSFRKEH